MEHTEQALTGEQEEQPVCLQCLTPVDLLEYYCSNCGYASGQITPYLPYENIYYNYSAFCKLWKRLWYEKTSITMKIVGFALIVQHAPIMFVGIPFVLWIKIRRPTARLQKSEDDFNA